VPIFSSICLFSVISVIFSHGFYFYVSVLLIAVSGILMFNNKYVDFCNLHLFTDLIFILRRSFYCSGFFIPKV
jgi:hypothetical protein